MQRKWFNQPSIMEWKVVAGGFLITLRTMN